MMRTVGSTGDLKQTVDTGTNISPSTVDDNNRGRLIDSIYSKDGDGQSGRVTKTDIGNDEETRVRALLVGEGADREETETKAVHWMISVIGQRREMRDAVSMAIGEFPAYKLFGVYDGPRLAKACGERLRGLVAEEIRACDGGGVAGDWCKMMKACFPGVEATAAYDDAPTVVVVGKDEVVVSGHGHGPKVVLYHCHGGGGGATLPLHHDNLKLLYVRNGN